MLLLENGTEKEGHTHFTLVQKPKTELHAFYTLNDMIISSQFVNSIPIKVLATLAHHCT